MGCSCGGRRAGETAALATGIPVVYRVTHPTGATVDYWTEGDAQRVVRAVQGATYARVDARTGVAVG